MVLVGLPGSGKTTLGRMLADEIGYTFLDTDQLIETRERRTIAAIFAEDGEAYFRDRETEITSSLAVQNRMVIATGGGIVLREGNIGALKKCGRVVFIDRDPAKIAEKISFQNRPLLKNGADALFALAIRRRNRYISASDAAVKNNAALETALQELLELVPKAGREKA